MQYTGKRIVCSLHKTCHIIFQ